MPRRIFMNFPGSKASDDGIECNAMTISGQKTTTRRQFVLRSALLTGGISLGLNPASSSLAAETESPFFAYQQRRRADLWGLLGDLPWQHQPAPPKLIRTEEHDGYTIERLLLDLNGIEPVPALLLIPKKLKRPAPGALFMHWHAGMYGLGKEQLLQGTSVQPAYAPVLAEMGVVTLAIDSWCFGERQHDTDGHRGEEDAFKLMLWRGQVLWGMMVFDEFRALSYLASRPEVDPQRLAATGMSMGATKTWWLAALDPRIRLAIDFCCLTDFDSLIAAHGLSGHSILYYVPSLLKEFDTTAINQLIVPRPRLSLNGRKDPLTPPAGVEKIRDSLLSFYQQHGRQQDCRIELFDCAHEETPEMRGLAIDWMRRYLTAG
jgi:dienelactone hydrolase